MAHRALTLKYRPQVFADMIGQDHVSTVLARALESGRVAHAYLFTGARGVGKTTSARILAKALNCERRASGELKGADPCNECTSCREITTGVSLDVAEIDGASNRGIADVQALREKVRFSPTGGRYRVVIIDEVHQLSNDAFAALLKTLEEPPPHLVFIFATTDPQKVPDTIRSRTQRFDFARVPFRKVADRLLEIQKREKVDPDGVRFDLTEGAALLLAFKSEGSLRDAVSALDQVVSAGESAIDEELVRRILGLADREAFFELAEAIVQHDPKAALHRLHQAFEKGLDARELAEGLSEHIRHILILKVDPDGGDLVAASGEDLKRMCAQGESWSEGDLLRLLRLASEVTVPMRDSPQPLIHLEAAVLQMATLEPGDTLAELLARIDALEQRLGGGTEGTSSPGGGAPAREAARSGSGGTAATTPTRSSAAPPPGPEPPRAQAQPPYRSAFEAIRARELAGGAAPPAAVPPVSRPPVALATDEAAVESELLCDDDTRRCWSEAVAGVNRRKRMLGAFLEESIFLGRGGSDVVLAMDEMHRAVIDDKENRALLADEVRRAFGQPLELRCAPLAAARPRAPRAPEDVQAMVDQAVAWFGAEPRPQPREERTNG